jgi:hypothetical protein
MTREEFLAALDRYGGDLGSWPSSLRGDAATLAARDAEAAAALDRQARLDVLLGAALTPEPVDAALIGRIVAHRRTADGERLQPTRRAIGWVSAAIAATLLIGFIAGANVPAAADDGSELYAALIFGGSDLDTSGAPL